MHVSTQLPWQAAENASRCESSVRRITVHMRQPRYLGTYLSERTAAAAIAGATKDPLMLCGQVQLMGSSGFSFLFFCSALAKTSADEDCCDLKGLLNPATTGLFRGILGLGEALAMSPKLLFCIVGRASRSQKMYIDRLLFREVKETLATAGTSSGEEF